MLAVPIGRWFAVGDTRVHTLTPFLCGWGILHHTLGLHAFMLAFDCSRACSSPRFVAEAADDGGVVCVCACLRARVCVRVCVRACVHVRERVFVCFVRVFVRVFRILFVRGVRRVVCTRC